MMDVDVERRSASSSGMRVEARSSGKQARARGEQAGAITEFAFVMPVFLLVVFGFIWFGITLNNYFVLTSATNTSAEYLSTIASMTTGPGLNPCQYTGTEFYSVGPGLVPAKLSFTINVATSIASEGPPVTYNWTSVIANAAGGSGLPSCGPISQTAGLPIQLIVTYPCSLYSFGFNFPCNLTAQSSYISQ